MRDLQADLEEFNHWMCDNYDTYDHTLMWFIKVFPHATIRAIRAESRVETLEIVARENYRMYENTLVENIKLRKVVDAARDGNTFALLQALAELDEEDTK